VKEQGADFKGLKKGKLMVAELAHNATIDWIMNQVLSIAACGYNNSIVTFQ